MFYYLLEQYKNDIYKQQMRKFGEFNGVEKCMIILLGISIISSPIVILLKMTRLLWITLGVFCIVMVFLFIFENNYSRKTNLKAMLKYEIKINKTIDLLTIDAINMYNRKSLEWLIEECDNYLMKNEKKDFFGPIKSFFLIIVYPIITSVATLIIRDMAVKDVVFFTTIIVALLITIFATGFAYYPIINNFFNRNNIVAETFKEDLRYILLHYETKKLILMKEGSPLCSSRLPLN